MKFTTRVPARLLLCLPGLLGPLPAQAGPAAAEQDAAIRGLEKALDERIEESRSGPLSVDERRTAEGELARLKRAKGRDSAHFLSYGRACRKLGKLSEAEAAFKKAARLAPDSERPLLELAALYRKRKKPAPAARALEKAWALRPKDYGIARQLADCYGALGRFDDAVEVYRVAEASCPRCPELYIGIGYARLDQGKDGEALAAFEKAVELDPGGEAQPYHHLAVFFAERGRLDEAAEIYRRALRIEEESPSVDPYQISHTLNHLADVYVQLDKTEEVQPLYERAKQLAEAAPGNYAVLRNAAQVAACAERWEESRLLLERAAEAGGRRPDYAATLHRLARTFARKRRFSEAETGYLKAIALYEEAPDQRGHPLALKELAELYVRMENYEKAEAWYERSIAVLEKTPESRSLAAVKEDLAKLRREHRRP